MLKTFVKKNLYYIILFSVLLFGIFLRLKGLLMNPSLWHDECALAWNIKFKSYSDFFGILPFGQMAPPFFMIATKLITKIFGVSDIVLRFIPFAIGCLSIVVFYFLSSKVLNRNFSILFAVFLFVINQRLINYSFEFKPYGIDVFFTIIYLLFFVNLDIEKLSIKKAVFYGILLSIIPWFSFVSVFILVGGFLNLVFKNIKGIKSNLLKKAVLALPIIISGLIYFKIYLINNYTGTGMVDYWQGSFVTANPLFFLYLLVESIRYLFFPIQYVLFSFILLIWGMIIFYREKAPFVNISVLGFILFIIASFFHFYPFSSRLILFLLPIFLLLIVKPLDSINFGKKFKSFIAIFFLLSAFYLQINSVNYFLKSKTFSRGEYPREMMEFLVKSIKPDDIIFVNGTSDTEFAYYSSFYDIENTVIQENVTDGSKEKYLAFLNSLKPGYYWFYLPYDSSRVSVFPNILSWAETKKVIYSYKNNKSILMYVYVH